VWRLHKIIAELAEEGKDTSEEEAQRKKTVEEAVLVQRTRKKIEELLQEYKVAAQDETKLQEAGPGKKKKRKLSALYDDPSSAEKVVKLLVLRNMGLSFEKLLLNLGVFFVARDEEVYESVKELKTCYKNVRSPLSPSVARLDRTGDRHQNQQEG
jgi:hypothetical protein